MNRLYTKMINQDNYSSYAKTNPAREELIAKFQEPRFNYFTSFIDISYIKNKVMLSTFVKMFDKYYDLIETLLNEEDIQKFNNYIFNQKDFDFPFNVDTFYQDRINFIKKNINNNKIDRILAHVFFNESSHEIPEIIKHAQKLNIENIPMYDSNKPKSIETFLENFGKIPSPGLKLHNEMKEAATAQLVKELAKNIIVKNEEIIKLDGQKFYMLAHKICGLSDYDFARELTLNPARWHEKYDPNGYISTSAISNNHLGMVDGSGYIMGFNNPLNSQILQMGPTDIMMEPHMVTNNQDSKYALYLSPEELIRHSYIYYNEVVLKRYNDLQVALMPSSIIALDQVTAKDREVSSYFKVPTYQIDTKAYVDKMIEKYNYALKRKEGTLAADIMLSLITGFHNSNYAFNMFFDKRKMERELENIMATCRHLSIDDMNYIINQFDKIKFLLNYHLDEYVPLDIDHAKMLMK